MELIAEAYQQLASVSAVLGGLAFTAVAAILNAGASTDDPGALSRSAKITAGTAVSGTVCFVACAVMWAFMAADVNRAAAYDTPYPQHASNVNWIPSIGFVIGSLLLLASVGASGWIASRKMGRTTSAVAALGGIAMIAIFVWFA